MRVGLHDADAEHIRHKSFPNYALMKISAFHKAQGDQVDWWVPIFQWMPEYQYDIIYSSKIFDFTEENPFLPDHTIKGGTGYDIKKRLPLEIDDMFPDYSIYPKCDYAIGFLTRGCPNHCAWCYVPEKEGEIKPYRTWKQLIRPDSNKLILMDNNILACHHGIEQLYSLIDSGIKIDLNQGMDIRLVTEEYVKLFKKLDWIEYIRFSCDHINQLPYFHKVIELFKKYGIGLSKLYVYLLVQKDIENAEYRVRTLHQLDRNINIFAQAERNAGKGIIPNSEQLEFAQRYIYGRKYKVETWSHYRQSSYCRI